MIDIQLQLATRSDTTVEAGYACPCGCRPSVELERGTDHVEHTCCCGTHFVVGREAESHLHARPGFRVEVQEFFAPWGDAVEAAWAIGSGEHPHSA